MSAPNQPQSPASLDSAGATLRPAGPPLPQPQPCARPPVKAKREASWTQPTTPLALVKQTMPKDPAGCLMLGPDGVLRSFAADLKTVIGAAGLNPEQIMMQLDELRSSRHGGWPARGSDRDFGGVWGGVSEEGLQRMKEAFKGVDGSIVTDTKALFAPGGECRPPRHSWTFTDDKLGEIEEIDDDKIEAFNLDDPMAGTAEAPSTIADMTMGDALMPTQNASNPMEMPHPSTAGVASGLTTEQLIEDQERLRQQVIERIDKEQEERERELFDEIERDKQAQVAQVQHAQMVAEGKLGR